MHLPAPSTISQLPLTGNWPMRAAWAVLVVQAVRGAHLRDVQCAEMSFEWFMGVWQAGSLSEDPTGQLAGSCLG